MVEKCPLTGHASMIFNGAIRAAATIDKRKVNEKLFALHTHEHALNCGEAIYIPAKSSKGYIRGEPFGTAEKATG